MPLGLAKAVLGQPTIAAAASGYAAYRQTNAIGSGNFKGHSISGLDFGNDNDVSMVMWFRANGTSDWLVSGNPGGIFFNSAGDDANGFIRMRFTLQDFGWQMSLNDSRNAYVDGRKNGVNSSGGESDTETPSSQATLSFTGGWKCILVSLKSDYNTGGNSNTDGSVGERDHISMYIGDTDITNVPNGHTRGVWEGANFTKGHMGYNQSAVGSNDTMNTSGNLGSGIHLGPMWIYNSQINFHTQSERRKFFNPSNTDGFVSPTNTGTTSAGAAQPNLYLYWNGSNLVNGGSDSITITERTVGTGGSLTSVSDGPGSGGTI